MRRRWIYPLALIAVVLLGASLLVVTLNQPHSQGYTKVYFESDIFPRVEPNRTYELAFLIESHEEDVSTYVYAVYLDNSSIETGKVTLNPGDLHRIQFSFSIDKVDYSKRVLLNETRTLKVNGSSDVVGAPRAYGIDLAKFNLTGEDLIHVLENFPLMYVTNETSIIVNTTNGTSISDVSMRKDGDRLIETRREFNLTRSGDGYVLSLRTLKVEYVPRPVEIRVVVVSSSGEKYSLRALLESGG
ncbi:carbohydrate binding domain-containing protein [Thermococcus camini]|uniref:Uncharacterized protein n=1 Tax=Thermococcus camini TaxID=2016373 RepID=A0A7G2D8J4_9EURY|nr:hypothetical protein [Thermococcus camini]CAD5243312.1 conserved exported protein of unknown function [Thermococcus camini]